MNKIKELDTVALLNDLPDKKLFRGDVGTVVVDLSESMAEVEFVDQKGRAAVLDVLEKKELIRLRLETATA